ncbi:MAG TPA: ribose 5-phosphate isomerase B [Phycisphaerales bacterium]|nr:ribose 5-phosphate isomerase B [Phycisphaerales bacterium]
MKLALSADHRGVGATKQLADRLRSQGHEVVILGSMNGDTCDYPDPAYSVGLEVSSGRADRGILLCGSGIGMSIAANKVKGVRAALVHDELTAEMSRSHNDANVVCMSADLLGQKLIEKIVDIWMTTPFQGGRHERRVKKIHAIENGVDPATMG